MLLDGAALIAMALSIAALAANGATLITGAECIDKSHPNFAIGLISVRAKITCYNDVYY